MVGNSETFYQVVTAGDAGARRIRDCRHRTRPVSPAVRRVWAVVPAAGRGMRFDPSSANGPKQYAPLLGSTVIGWSLSALLAEPRIEGIVVVLAADDLRFGEIAAALPGSKLLTAIGGASRQESVMNGLRALDGRAAGGDWVAGARCGAARA